MIYLNELTQKCNVMNDVNEQYISIEELEFIMNTGKRSISTTPNFPKPAYKETGIDYYKREEVESFIGTNLDEKFIELDEVSQITNKNPGLITKYSSDGLIPCYRIKKGQKGSKYLYKKSEVLLWNQEYVNPTKDDSFFFRLYFSKSVSQAMNQIFQHSALENYLNKNQRDVLLLVLSGQYTHEFIGDQLGITRERVRQIFNTALYKILKVSKNFGSVELENIKLKKENTRLQNELNLIKRQIDYTNVIKNASSEENVEVSYLNTLVEKFSIVIKYDNDVSSYLSVRALNIVGGNDMETIGDLVSFGKKRIRGLRNLGKKTIQEFDEVLQNLGLKFIDEYNDHDQLLVIKKAIQLSKKIQKV